MPKASKNSGEHALAGLGAGFRFAHRVEREALTYPLVEQGKTGLEKIAFMPLCYLLLDANLSWHRLGVVARRIKCVVPCLGVTPIAFDRFPEWGACEEREQGEELWAEF